MKKRCFNVFGALMFLVLAFSFSITAFASSELDDESVSPTMGRIIEMATLSEVPEKYLDCIYRVFMLPDDELRVLYAPFTELIHAFNVQHGTNALSHCDEITFEVSRFAMARTIVTVTPDEFEQSLLDWADIVIALTIRNTVIDAALEVLQHNESLDIEQEMAMQNAVSYLMNFADTDMISQLHELLQEGLDMSEIIVSYVLDTLQQECYAFSLSRAEISPHGLSGWQSGNIFFQNIAEFPGARVDVTVFLNSIRSAGIYAVILNRYAVLRFAEQYFVSSTYAIPGHRLHVSVTYTIGLYRNSPFPLRWSFRTFFDVTDPATPGPW